MSLRVTSISFQKETLEKLDKTRGLIPRSTYVEDILSNHLKKSRKGKH